MEARQDVANMSFVLEEDKLHRGGVCGVETGEHAEGVCFRGLGCHAKRGWPIQGCQVAPPFRLPRPLPHESHLSASPTTCCRTCALLCTTQVATAML